MNDTLFITFTNTDSKDLGSKAVGEGQRLYFSDLFIGVQFARL